MDLPPAGAEFKVGGYRFPLLVERGVPFYGVELPFQWVGIGSTPDLWNVIRMILRGEVDGYRMPGREVRQGIWTGINVCWNPGCVNITGPVYIGSARESHCVWPLVHRPER